MYRVLLVEDDRGIADALCAQLGDWALPCGPWRISAT